MAARRPDQLIRFDYFCVMFGQNRELTLIHKSLDSLACGYDEFDVSFG